MRNEKPPSKDNLCDDTGNVPPLVVKNGQYVRQGKFNWVDIICAIRTPYYGRRIIISKDF